MLKSIQNLNFGNMYQQAITSFAFSQKPMFNWLPMKFIARPMFFGVIPKSDYSIPSCNYFFSEKMNNNIKSSNITLKRILR